jgi:2-polyprenyl-3-methyl-5-hydroxy-6-metoxy-1,4-benzoquinol methylase
MSFRPNRIHVIYERLFSMISYLPVSNRADRKQDRVYANYGNTPLLNMLNDCKQLLDVGCGAGDNALLLKKKRSACKVYGITHSTTEAQIAGQHMVRCWVFDLEEDLPADLASHTFDAIVFSHVLEHLRAPAEVVARFSRLLRARGQVLIAVPNILSWRMRLQFLMGNFTYESSGVLDDTHLRFFTYFTADQYLFALSPDLEVTCKTASGSVPLWWLRRYVFPQAWCEAIDRWGCRLWPNLFGGQILISAVKL